MFFADKVILVEGGEKYVLESLAKYYGLHVQQHLGENWLDDQNISIIAVGGKTEFWKYVKKLNELAIENYVVADFDFLFDGLNDYVKNVNASPLIKEEVERLKGKIGLQKSNIPKSIDDLASESREQVNLIIERIKEWPIHSNRLYILKGDLEYYFTELAKSMFEGVKGKEMRAIYLVSDLVNEENTIIDFIAPGDYFGLFDLIYREMPPS